MRNQYHILNGDALKEQFPDAIEGEIIVARECLVDGDVSGDSLEELFSSRAGFLNQHYGVSEKEYYEKTASEFLKIQLIKSNSDINLWFEDDLFCQANFWFTVHLLLRKSKDYNIFLVRPKTHTRFGFGGLTKSSLMSIYKERVQLKELDKISKLWKCYQLNDIKEMKHLAQELEKEYPFISKAVDAHIQRKPTNAHVGRPTQSLLTIMKEFQTEDFAEIFQEFCKRESIYGFGDLQVKRLYDQIMNNR